jgi:EmrB/QacA subfamily drug resistance transporter
MSRHILIPLIVACALFMENMDSTIIATSLPAIAEGFHEHPLALNLALTSYLVSLAVFIPISGWVADRIGSRTVFMTAIVVFMAGSLLCSVVDTLPAFVAARFIQGIGGAMMVPVGRLVLLKSVPKSELVVALNYLTIPALVGPVIGPALGGLITEYFNWRWIFLINIPISLLGLILAYRFIPNFREDDVPRLDLPGFALSGIGLAALILGLSTMGRHLLPGEAATGLMILGVAGLAAYAWHARRTRFPLINMSLLSLPTLRAGVVGGGLFRMGAGATPFLLPLLFQLGFGLNPFESGLLTCATALGAMFMKTFTVRILRRYGFRAVLTGNALLASASIMSFGLFTASTSHWLIVAVLLISGCMRSLQFTALNAISFADIAREDMSNATSLSSMAQRLSQSVGVAFGALSLQVATSFNHSSGVQAGDFRFAFAAVGLLSTLSMLWLLRLPHDAGAEVSGHRARVD